MRPDPIWSWSFLYKKGGNIVSCIKEDVCLNSADYLNLVTDREITENLTLEQLEKLKLDVWNYPLTEIEHIIENQIQVVLVRFPKKDGDYEYRFCELFSEERKIPNSIPIVNDADVYVEFSRVDLYPEEEKMELWLWVKNQLNEMIYVSAMNVMVNCKEVYWEYPLDELGEGKKDYLKMTLQCEDLRKICSYSELKQVEFSIVVYDAEVKPLLWSNKVEILLDMTAETNPDYYGQKRRDRKIPQDIRYQMKL